MLTVFRTTSLFKLTVEEWTQLRSQIVILRKPTGKRSQIASASEGKTANWSQIVTSLDLRRGRSYRPYALTEFGALMAANVSRAEVDQRCRGVS